MTDKEYFQSQLRKLKNTKYGFKIKIFDNEGNSTNYLNITSDNAKEIINILTKDEGEEKIELSKDFINSARELKEMIIRKG